ncbi:MAG: hypothetical protein R3B47_21295 [Bacteroidia bacterium]
MKDTIEQYLDGQLSEAEQAAFEQRLDSEPDLVSEFEAAVAARAAVLLTAREARHSQLRNRYEGGARVRSLRPPAVLLLAAAAVLLFFFLLKGVFSPAQSPEALYAQYFQNQSLSGLRSVDDASYDSWKKLPPCIMKAGLSRLCL